MAYGYSCTIHVVYKGCNGHVEIDREERDVRMYISTRTKYTHTYPVQIYIPVAAMALQGLESDFH